MRSKSVFVIVLLLLLASCGLVEKGTHNAGKNCMWPGCHGYEAPAWTYAGTTFTTQDRSAPARGLTVSISDSMGEIELTSNSAGNFYTNAGDPAGGYRASISDGDVTKTMGIEPISGACNSCHAPDSQAPPLHIP